MKLSEWNDVTGVFFLYFELKGILYGINTKAIRAGATNENSFERMKLPKVYELA